MQPAALASSRRKHAGDPWLEATVVEEDQNDENRGGKPRRKVTRNTQGTPQGGVISPLLANLYLHWFDRAVYGENGPVKWAKVGLVSYEVEFVILCKMDTQRQWRIST